MVEIGFAILIFTLVSVAMLCLLLFISWLVRPIKYREGSDAQIECGMIAEGEHRGIGFNFLHYAFLFLIFDLAAIYIFLYAIMKQPPGVITVNFLLGISILLIAIIYATQERKYYVA